MEPAFAIHPGNATNKNNTMKEFKYAVRRSVEIVNMKPLFGARFTAQEMNQRASKVEPYKREDVIATNWERGWGCSCSLRVSLVESENQGKPVWTVKSEISWSSTGRDICSALNAVTLYRDVIEIAAQIEDQWTWPSVPRDKGV